MIFTESYRTSKSIPNYLLARVQSCTKSAVKKEEPRLQLLNDILRRHRTQAREGFVELPLPPRVCILNQVDILSTMVARWTRFLDCMCLALRV